MSAGSCKGLPVMYAIVEADGAGLGAACSGADAEVLDGALRACANNTRKKRFSGS